MSIKEIIRSFSSERWAIGFVKNTLSDILAGVQIEVAWVRDSERCRWFADPFILKEDKNKIVILAEEINMNYRHGKVGRISRLLIDKSSLTILDVIPILELETHLSFPIIHRVNEDIFIYPENSESGCLTLYYYDDLNYKCTPVTVICDEPIADAVLLNYEGDNLLFATKIPAVNGNELRIYKQQDGVDKPYIFWKSIDFNENVARMAGNFFEFNKEIYRPTQECNAQYGHAITIQKLIKADEQFTFKEIRRIYSTHPKLKVGTHTFNIYNNIIVTDALGFDRMWIRKILKFFHLIP